MQKNEIIIINDNEEKHVGLKKEEKWRNNCGVEEADKKKRNDEIFPKDYLTTGATLTREKDKILSKKKGRRKEEQTKQLWGESKKAFKKLRETKK